MASILFPPGRLRVKKDTKQENVTGRNKTLPSRVYPYEHVHTRRGLDPLSLQARAILLTEGRNVKGIAVRNRDSRGEKR